MTFTWMHQAGLALQSVAVFGLSAVPLELQHRIVNCLTARTTVATSFQLPAGYAGVALAEQVLNLRLNTHLGWVAESRGAACAIAPGRAPIPRT